MTGKVFRAMIMKIEINIIEINKVTNGLAISVLVRSCASIISLYSPSLL
jgi:hypothetical protein